jgi:hypothetical protein
MPLRSAHGIAFDAKQKRQRSIMEINDKNIDSLAVCISDRIHGLPYLMTGQKTASEDIKISILEWIKIHSKRNGLP